HRVHDIFGNVIAEYHASGYLMTEYVWLEERPIAVIADAGGTPRTLWVHTDHLQRPVLMTDDSGDPVWEAAYLPFGEVASIGGSEVLDYRFPGQWFQLEAGLTYNWHRHGACPRA
ncbi:MAG: RHS repeat protein, partial [Candidatus Omnitrophica bacterium]|nr:RHS repeat protein [Candidatus Omnitrophota bacterium]